MWHVPHFRVWYGLHNRSSTNRALEGFKNVARATYPDPGARLEIATLVFDQSCPPFAKKGRLADIVGMRYLLVLLVFAMPVFGQDVNSTGAENPQTANWSKLGPAVEGSRGFALSGRGMRINRSGQYELWVKITPNDTGWFVRRYDLPKGTAYVMQYATVDCSKKLLLLERTAMFDSGQKQLEGRITGITPSSRKDAVKRGSIGETVFKYVCEDRSAVPATDGRD